MKRVTDASSLAVATRSYPSPVRMLWITAAWGACFVTIRWGLRDAPALWFATLRALVAGVALLAWGTARRRPAPRGWPAWRLIGALAVTNASLAFGAMFAGVAGSETGVAAVLANAQPLLILLPAWWVYGERVAPRTVVAMSAGFAGLVIVAGPGGGGRGAWLSVIAAIGITTGTLLARRVGSLDVVLVSAWHFVLGGVVLGVVASATEGAPAITWTPRFVAALGFLALIGTAAAYVAWFDEIQHGPLGPLAAWTFLVPVFGAGFGVILLGERPGSWTLAGVALVLISFWFVVRRRSDPATPMPMHRSSN
jgi:probable blue pigment (indigoidine) exporter